MTGEDAVPPPGRTAASGSLDQLLTDAALGPARRVIPGGAGIRAAARLAARPATVARRGLELGAELARVAAGRSELEPPRGDRRFRDPAWNENPAFRRLAQGYLALARTADRLVSDADLDWAAERRVRFAVENVVDAIAPSNFPATNPAVLKAAIDTGGRNFVAGARQLARDVARPPHLPAMVDRSAFAVGEDLAVTPGDVVLRTELFELIQYRPSTDRVRRVPLLVVPPMINKYYVADLAPGRSMIEYLVGAEQQVFAISWRNPDERHADWGLDAYAGAVLEALDAVRAITRSRSAHTLGLCAGGITLACAVAHLAATGEQGRIAGLTLGVCVIDNEEAGTAAALVDRDAAELALAESCRRGYLDGRALAGVFAWLRPNDLIWNSWINNYLLGKEPPAFDILYWNADTTNMPAALHRDFLEIALGNTLVRPGEQTVLGTPVDLGAIEADSYVVAGIADHITPWESGYRTTRLLGSEPRFVLSTSGHIAAMVNPPGNDRAGYRTADGNPPEAAEWLAAATKHRGTWWEDWARWLGERSGRRRAAPTEAGGGGFEPLGPAPGTYVHQSVKE
ncbi:MAG: poly[(R)-3-hydroxyalkanoate] polymerase subunit PhaC [Solirubrobacteraceae bacterium]|nr:poly[(R)-3-hydroxyalkanoate] polymerase subunit PhaC [Solirubrobacteraceae bacterium]